MKMNESQFGTERYYMMWCEFYTQMIFWAEDYSNSYTMQFNLDACMINVKHIDHTVRDTEPVKIACS